MRTLQCSPHAPREDSRATNRAECAQDTNHPHRTVPALGEQLRLPHENPSIGLVLCKSADKVQVRLAPTAAAVKKTGFATYQTALPDERLIQRRLEQLPNPSETGE